MPLSDDNSVFVGGEFGVSCTSGSTTANGILSQPSEVVLDGMVLFSDYTLQAKASDFGTLVANDSITVDSVAYTVRETRFSTDGQIVTIAIQKT
tara:strand:- start:150 stop:431 length:282 start_codon:yes stop_codon:yes gene_type:complete